MATSTSLLGTDGRADAGRNKKRHDGVFALVLVNLLFYVADHVLGLRFMQRLYLPLDGASFYQYVTSTFCHGGWMHLSGNMFFLYLFGRLVEEEEGTLGLVVAYLVTGVGGNIITEVFLTDGFALGASGSVFGLFVVSVLLKLKWSVRSVIEALILGQFVVMRVIDEAKSVGENDGVGHLAHLGGAVTGAALVFVVAKVLRKKPAEGAKGVSAKTEAPKAKVSPKT